MATGPITRVADVRAPKVGARVRFRTSSGDVVESVVGDNGRQFDYAKGDRLLRYHKPQRRGSARAPEALTDAPTAHGFYLNLAAHFVSLSAALFFGLKYWGVL